ncbi:bifunctional UDP-N-acetylglucosamine diphosphorylase/glucosamine-1-phosphate N-acetyltransferase GlmU [Marinithermus hydrothermalis]|uniref:Bifunctional protein GlmU n=1 Tax=Marinithermus hydrothermalis (strain DSM 14884 / JCM 11576 / T1) TaxID=869210 RepID=F2NLP9_MARHT|nr:bifunctional UDP-N-acetylglucosamine diphosphorylase/glucosamine-1-phosphate N-acetyltransferase GlmU [Marinithermus hydrothermalis]AEB10879.1 Bifunctional protein glmU [Marinithermus hydrothermalis DSM 14884]
MKHAVVILAAGTGTRMKSRLPKVLHPLLGKPMVAYAVEAAIESGAERVVVVVGHGAEAVQTALADYPVVFAHQAEQLGTAHALMQAEQALEGFEGRVLVTYGDTPLLSGQTLARLAGALEAREAGMVLLSLVLEDPTGYGRVLRGADGSVHAVVEEKDAGPEEKRVREVNSGVYAFDANLWAYLKEVRNHNASGEYYLTDLVQIYRAHGHRVVALEGEDPAELLGVNTRAHLAEVERILLERLRRAWMLRGVRMIQPETIYLEPTVELARDVTLWPGVILRGRTRIGEGSVVGAYSVLVDTVVEADAEVRGHTVAEGAVIRAGAGAGPFARLRPGAELEAGAHVGNFVEVKNARIGPGAKAGHLAYLGDAEVGEGANIGAGMITANYDGKRKHRTRIGKGAFIGSNAVLVAPVEVGDGALVGAGSVITQDVPAGALGVARGRQRNIEGYAERKRREE